MGLTPTMVTALVDAGHTVLVEAGAGEGTGFPDDAYRDVGARFTSQEEAWAEAEAEVELLVKVEGPVGPEYGLLRPDLTLFAYLHLAVSRPLTEAMLDSGVTGIAYETVRVGRTLPLLRPMSEIAGRRPWRTRCTTCSSTPGVPGSCWALASGVSAALEHDAALAAGLATHAGQLHSPGVAAAFPDLPAAV